MKLRLLILSILSFFLVSCAGDQVYDKKGLSFTYPGDWQIYTEESYGKEGHYVSVEKKGFNQSGFLAVTWYLSDEETTLEDEINETYELYAEDEDYECTSITAATFNGIPGFSFSYRLYSDEGIPHSGTLYVFETEKKIVEILKQEADEDTKKNVAGFALIESTLKIE